MTIQLRSCGSALAVVCVVLAGCSGSDDDAAVATPSSVDTEVATTVGATESTSSAPSTTAAPDTAPASSAPATTPAATTPPSAPEPLFGSFDELIDIETQPGQSPGRPILMWSTVEGVDHYGVYVYAPSGQIYWSWQGYDTSIPLGGNIGNAAGPSASNGMTWAVVAYDAALLPITVSNKLPLDL